MTPNFLEEGFIFCCYYKLISVFHRAANISFIIKSSIIDSLMLLSYDTQYTTRFNFDGNSNESGMCNS